MREYIVEYMSLSLFNLLAITFINLPRKSVWRYFARMIWSA
jgi:hypothetical protein